MADLLHSPARVLAQWLYDQTTHVTDPTTNGEWPLFIGHLPATPVNAMAIYTTQGFEDGKAAGCVTLVHPGIQFTTRSENPDEGYVKAELVRRAVDLIHNDVVVVASNAYTIINLRLLTPVGQIGKEESTRATLHTCNFIATIAEG